MKLFAFLLAALPLIACAQPPKPVGKPSDVPKVSGDVAETADFEKADPKNRLDVFVLGDSITAGDMAYGTNAELMKRTRNRTFKGWALNLFPAEKDLKGVFERLGDGYPVRLTNAAWSGAYVDKATPLDRSMANLLGGIQNFSNQMARLRKLKVAPNLVLLAPFHNNLDFQFDLDTVATLKGTKKEDYLAKIPKGIKQEYHDEIAKVIDGTPKGTKLSLVILGLLNLKAPLEVRVEAEKLHKADPKVFPHFDVAKERFPSILQPKEIVALSEKVNEALAELATEFTADLKKAGRSDEIEVVYSKALNRVALNEARYLHADDAFHPSALGHNLLAEAVEADLADRIQFLGAQRR